MFFSKGNPFLYLYIFLTVTVCLSVHITISCFTLLSVDLVTSNLLDILTF